MSAANGPAFLRPTGRRRRLAAVVACGAVATVLVGQTPALADRTRDAQWHLDFLNVARAHRITEGAGVTVAVVDTGVDARHPDLAGAVVAGRDVAILREDPPDGRTDLDGHGTGMAGLIAGRGRGGSGALGIAPAATILPVRDADDVKGRTSDTHSGIRWAVERGADVISMSFGGEDDPDLAQAIEDARRADVVLVAAAGNAPDDSTIGYPAAYPGVIAVGGVDRRGNHASISVTGPEIDIVAPAVDITSTGKGRGYRTGTGTSDATAIVAGAAALVRAKYPDLSAAEVAHRLTATATDKGPSGRDDRYGYGVLNLVAALTADVPPLPVESAEPLPTSTWTRPGPPPMAQPEPRGSPMGVLAIGLGCVLLASALAGAAAWLFFRRRRA